jgi:di/tricarboxylate transporter
MNQYQRIGTFLIRLIGFVVAIVGALGGIHATAVRAGIVAASPSRPPSAWWSALWLASGLVLLSSANVLGRWLGRGLD